MEINRKDPQSSSDEKKKSISPYVIGAAGLAIGAGAAAAAAIALKDPKNREKAKNALASAKHKSEEYSAKFNANPKVIEGKQKMQKALADLKDKMVKK